MKYEGPGACFVKYLPLAKYMELIAPYTGAIFIAIGAVMCFAGSRVLPIAIATLVALAVTGLLAMVGYNFLDQETAQLWHLLVLVLAALAFGVLAGIAARKLAEDWAVTILAFWVGLLLALMILKMAQVEDQNITLGAAAVAGGLGALLGSKFNDSFKKIGTAIVGSFLTIRGIAMYLGHFPSEFNSGSVDDIQKLKEAAEGTQLYYILGYVAGFVILSIIGTIFQLRNFQSPEKDGDEMANEDEGKCCAM